jgi:LmbE family N-acetylglucosaminyl deacetylase
MSQDSCVVLSPHLDDAVLSAWHVVSAPCSVAVVTVFAGIPEPGFVTDLDRSHGAKESAAWLLQRRREDRAALALAGRTPMHLDLPEIQFAAFQNPEIRELIARSPEDFLAHVARQPTLGTDTDGLAALVDERIPATPVLYGPAGVGGHPDHRDLAQATIRLAVPGREVRLYADSPYYLVQGLPSWVTGIPNPAADALTEEALARLDLAGRSLARKIVELDQAAFQRKLAAMRRYETEIPAIWADLTRAPGGPDAMRHEMYWTVGHARR